MSIAILVLCAPICAQDEVVVDSLLNDSLTIDTLGTEIDESVESDIVLHPTDSVVDLWDSTRVNPYQLPIDSMPDSLLVDCRGFVMPHQNVVTSEFGERWGRFHAGTDMRLTVGDTIRCAFDGRVRVTRSAYAMRKKGYGYFVMVRHDNGFETLYAHLSKVLVRNRQEMKAGDVIGLGGNTGRSTGPHLHFEIRYKGNPINPRKVIDFQTFEPWGEYYKVCKKESFQELDRFIHSPAVYHKVRSGDTLGAIARKYHTTVKKLCALNRIKPTTILRIGRRLRVR